MLQSQKSRKENPEIDPLLLGSGWTPEDLGKPQVLLESAYGDSHPGSRHLKQLVEEARTGVYKVGGKPAVYTVTDICDGVATGHDGMNYSLSDIMPILPGRRSWPCWKKMSGQGKSLLQRHLKTR